MKRKKLIILFLFVIGLYVSFDGYQWNEPANAFSNQVIQRGATGSDVIELQTRLKKIGYFKGKVDGVFGWGTYWAVRNFQKAFGMPVDGLVGPKTKAKLIRASGATVAKTTYKSAVNVPKGYTQNDIKLLSNAVYGESRGEAFIGQVAVAAVILNRVESPSFPNSVSGVIFEPGAFTAVSDGQIWLTPNPTAKKAVIDAINGWDPTNGAIYYYNPKTATSGWIRNRPKIIQIGNHIFCR